MTGFTLRRRIVCRLRRFNAFAADSALLLIAVLYALLLVVLYG